MRMAREADRGVYYQIEIRVVSYRWETDRLRFRLRTVAARLVTAQGTEGSPTSSEQSFNVTSEHHLATPCTGKGQALGQDSNVSSRLAQNYLLQTQSLCPALARKSTRARQGDVLTQD